MIHAPYSVDGFSGKNVLVTGGAGFIGSHLVHALVTLGAHVSILDDLSSGSWDNLAGLGRVQRFTGSITSPSDVLHAARHAEFIFHQAALVSVPHSVENPHRYYDVNVLGTINVLQAAKISGVRRVLFAGSSSAYGDPPIVGPKTEDMPTLPCSPYASTKVACEQALRVWSQNYGLDTVVLRYFNVFGPCQNPNSAYAAVIAAFAKAFNDNRPATIYGDGGQSRDFTYIDNVVYANLKAALHPGPLLGEIFNIATGTATDLNKLYSMMAKIYGINCDPIYAAPRAGDIRESQADISKARQVLCYGPMTTLDAGLIHTIGWYRKHLPKS